MLATAPKEQNVNSNGL